MCIRDSLFPVGTTTVICMARDAAGNTANCTFTVEVLDVSAPVLECPANVVAQCDSLDGVIVNYPQPVVTNECVGEPVIVCDPPSGSFFQPGATTITCTATDEAGNSSSCTFDVIVECASVLRGDSNASGEIDIVELDGAKPAELLGTLHYGGKWPHNRSSGDKTKLASGTFADRFHTFGIEWHEDEIRWTLDGKPWQTQKKWSTRSAAFPAPFDQRFHLLLNIAVGGRLVGAPSDATPFPARMEVDWIRVYQRK